MVLIVDVPRSLRPIKKSVCNIRSLLPGHTGDGILRCKSTYRITMVLILDGILRCESMCRITGLIQIKFQI